MSELVGACSFPEDEEQDVREVDRLYSTRLVYFSVGKHSYAIPANYFGAKDFRDEPRRPWNSFGFFLFLPDFGGYTKDNWRDPFDRRLIRVVSVEPVEKDAIGVFTDGSRRPLSPDRFDPRKRFELLRSGLDDELSFKMYGLEGYRRKNRTPGVIWTGTRSDGEFLYFQSSLAPGEPLMPGITNPLCQAQYYSDKEDLLIAYRYSMVHLAMWREIDDAIWSKVNGWRLR